MVFVAKQTYKVYNKLHYLVESLLTGRTEFEQHGCLE